MVLCTPFITSHIKKKYDYKTDQDSLQLIKENKDQVKSRSRDRKVPDELNLKKEEWKYLIIW